MCTSIVSNISGTIVGFNLDLLGMEHRVTVTDKNVFIEINDESNGWIPLFGADGKGNFVAMPTCWPYDNRSVRRDGATDIISLGIDLLLRKKSFDEVKKFVCDNDICCMDGVTFMSQISDKNGDALQIIPGQGYAYKRRPKFSVLTNFSPFKGMSEIHPWMGKDRYDKAVERLTNAEVFGVKECLETLKECSQTVCPTVVSIVFDAGNSEVFWCENREYENIRSQKISE